jgi:hypothetical protein
MSYKKERRASSFLITYHSSLITLSFCFVRFNVTRHVDRRGVARRQLSLNLNGKPARPGGTGVVMISAAACRGSAHAPRGLSARSP